MKAVLANELDVRSVDILDKIKHVFATKGFDGASMQDLSSAAGMSVGNFYRYFPSKAAIIEALIARDLSDVETQFSAVLRSPEPRAALLGIAEEHIRTLGRDDGPLWAEIEAAAARRAEVAAISLRMESAISENLTRVFALLSGLPEDEAAERFTPHARMMIVIVKGASIGHCAASMAMPQRTDERFVSLAMQTINRLLDDVVGQSEKRDIS